MRSSLPRNHFRALLAAAALMTVCGVAHADAPAAHRAPIPEPTADADRGADLGARLGALGRLRALGDDYDLAIGSLFAPGPETFRRWRTVADTLADTADNLPWHRVVLVAYSPRRGPAGEAEARERAGALRDALASRGVPGDRIRTTIAPRSAEGVELQVRFERIRPL